VEEHLAWARLGHGERGRRGRGGVGGADARVPFYRVRGGAGWPGIGEERAVCAIMAMKATILEGD
jgi:hypothetical protein